MATFHVTALWGEEASVWTVVETDVAGLSTEAETWSEFVGNIRALAPMLLRENGQIPKGQSGEVPIEVMARQVEQIHI